jgi:hypothetical protein
MLAVVADRSLHSANATTTQKTSVVGCHLVHMLEEVTK